MPPLAAIADFLHDALDAAAYPDEPPSRFRAGAAPDAPVRRLGLALDASPEIARWAVAADIDALFLHRPWGIERESFPPAIGIVASHLPFDERLTLGLNPRLAAALGMRDVQPFGVNRHGRTVGMIGDVAPTAATAFRDRVRDLFGGAESEVAGDWAEVRRVAVVGAMRADLVLDAAARGVDVYLTGQFRKPAAAAVAATGLGVVEIGHARSEQWGLGALAELLRGRWAAMEVWVAPEPGHRDG